MKLLRTLAMTFVIALVLLWITSVLKPSPQRPDIDSMPRLGVDADYNFSTTTVNAAGDSGVKILRAHLSWTNIEPNNTDPSHYNWSYYDSVFSRIAAAGLSPIVVLDKCPTWACPYFRGPINPANMADFEEFVRAVAARYGQDLYKAQYWELFDEPDGTAGANGQWNYGNHPAEYVQALKVFYNTIKAANPQAIVMNGGLAYDYPTSFRPQFLTETLAYGAAQYMDALNFHYFRINGPGWTTIKQKAAELRGVMQRAGADLPLVCTSVGESSENIAPWYSSEAQQARYAVKVNVQSAAAGIQSTVWYMAQDFDCQISNGCTSGWLAWARHGMIKLDGTQKMAYTAMQVLAQEVGSMPYLRQLGPEVGVTGGLEGYQFGFDNSGGIAGDHPQVSVVWNNDPGTTNLTIPSSVAPNLIGAIDISGQSLVLLPESDGTMVISLGSNPVYLEWRNTRFIDVDAQSTFYPYIDGLAQLGVVSGFADGTFRPNAPGNRGTLCKIIVLAHGWTPNTTDGPHFTDVPPTSVYYPYVETAFNRGIIVGYSDGTFRPYDNVTRGQLCKIIVNARGWPLSNPGVPTFSDVLPIDIFYQYIETAFSHGVLSGYSDGTFRPANQAGRGQICKIVYNAVFR